MRDEASIMSMLNKRRSIRGQSTRGRPSESIGELNIIKSRKLRHHQQQYQEEQSAIPSVPILANNCTSLMQRLTCCPNETNSETTTTATTTTTICQLRSNHEAAQTMSENRNKTRFMRNKFELRKARQRNSRALDGEPISTPSERFCSLLNMVALILIVATIGIGFPGQQASAEQASSSRANSNNKQLVDGVESRQLQLLRSANVELSRERSQRLQRDTSPTPNVNMASSSPAIGDQATMPASSSTGINQQGQPTCGYPGSPAHASVTFNTSLVVAGTAASYTCDNGYELLGPPRRLCQANGTWSPVGIPFCGK